MKWVYLMCWENTLDLQVVNTLQLQDYCFKQQNVYTSLIKCFPFICKAYPFFIYYVKIKIIESKSLVRYLINNIT